MSALLLHVGPAAAESVTAALRQALPDIEVRLWPSTGDKADIEYALVSRIPAGELAKYPNLRLVGSLHAGADHLLNDPSLPTVPIVRSAREGGDVLMNEYVLTQVLAHHRDMPAYALNKANGRWAKKEPLPSSARRVGVLGLGSMGLPVAEFLAKFGFDVAGWVRRPRADSAIPAYAGAAGLHSLLRRSEIVVNMLPLTPTTDGILDAEAFAALPRGSAVINVGRGEHIVDADLLDALSSGQISAVTLDVFRQEPLPPEHAFWSRPEITITPHACRRVSVEHVVRDFAANARRLNAGEPLLNEVDRSRGY